MRVHNLPYINVYKSPDDGSQLQPKHVALYKLIKLVLCVNNLLVYIYTYIYIHL